MKTSICVPTYDGAPFIREAILSILNQSYSDFELIIVDDCSNDSTRQIVLAIQDSRIKFYDNSTRLGMTRNWNRCLHLASGAYICIFHQDDLMQPENIAQKVHLLEQYPELGFVYSQALRVDEEGVSTGEHWVPQDITSLIYRRPRLFHRLVSGPNIICCPSVVARSSVYRQMGGFATDLAYTCDWEMWMRLGLFYSVAYLAEPLVKYRWHSGNTTQQYGYTYKGLDEELQAKLSVLSRHASRIPNSMAIRRKVSRNIADRAFRQAYTRAYGRDFREARRSFLFALRVEPKLAISREGIGLAARLLLGEHGAEAASRARRLLSSAAQKR